MDKDIIIIGGGPGGYVAAIRAAQLGANVLIVEKEAFGGTCLNAGCIPTKTLYRTAQVADYMSNASKFGISLSGEFNVDMVKVLQRKRKIIKKLTMGVELLLKSNKVEVIKGAGKLVDGNTIYATCLNGETKTITAKNIIIATGSKTFIPKTKGIEFALTSNEALELSEVPKSMLIIGGGVIGIEFASIFSAFGSNVTVTKRSPTILSEIDCEISNKLRSILTKRGVKILTKTTVKEIEKVEDKFFATIDTEGEVSKQSFDKVLVCAGREAYIEGLGLDDIGVKYNGKGIVVDENYRTNIQNIYAIGDVVGKAMLAHVASEEGKACVEKIMNEKADVNYGLVPISIFTFPEVSCVGLSEEEAKEKGIQYSVSKFPFMANGKALTMEESEGMVKVIASNGKIIGVSILGAHASDLIHEAVVAMAANISVSEIGKIMHGHPTLPEAFLEAVLGIDKMAIHMLN